MQPPKREEDRTIAGSTNSSDTLERDGSAASVLRGLGARVRTVDLRRNPTELISDDDPLTVRPRALIFETLDPGAAVLALKAARAEPYFDGVGTLVAVSTEQILRVQSADSFDDFIRYPYVREELDARIRALEWRRANERAAPPRQHGRLVIDAAGQQAYVNGRPVRLTRRDFALLECLHERRGRSVSRARLLERVWSDRPGAALHCVDVLVCRLRSKLHDAHALETVRGGYMLPSVTDDPPPAPLAQGR